MLMAVEVVFVFAFKGAMRTSLSVFLTRPSSRNSKARATGGIGFLFCSPFAVLCLCARASSEARTFSNSALRQLKGP